MLLSKKTRSLVFCSFFVRSFGAVPLIRLQSNSIRNVNQTLKGFLFYVLCLSFASSANFAVLHSCFKINPNAKNSVDEAFVPGNIYHSNLEKEPKFIWVSL